MLLEIFSFLQVAALKNATLVCSKWNDVISTSQETMLKLPLTVNLRDAEALDQIYGYSRQLTSLKIIRGARTSSHSSIGNEQHDIQFMRRYFRQRGSQLRKLMLHMREPGKIACFATDRLCGSLRSLRMLQRLDIDNVCLRTEAGRQQTNRPALLWQLKQLHVRDTDWKLFRGITAPNLEQLTVSGSGYFDNSPRHLTGFLKASPNLHALALQRDVFEDVFNAAFPFTLEQFSYLVVEQWSHMNTSSFSVGHCEKLNTFIGSQAQLKRLEMCTITTAILHTIFDTLRMLNTLALVFPAHVGPPGYHERLPKNDSIIHLYLNTFVPAYAWIFTKCPSLLSLNGVRLDSTTGPN